MPDETTVSAGDAPAAAAPKPVSTDLLLPTSMNLVEMIDVGIAPAITRLLIPTEWFRDELQKKS